MDKQKVLSEYKKQEDKLLLAQVLDKIEFSRQREKIEYTDFLDMYQTALVKTFLRKIEYTNYVLFGGFEDAERKILIVYPEKYTLEMIEKNYNKIINVIRIILSDEEKGKYTHRNYLGGIIKLGISIPTSSFISLAIPKIGSSPASTCPPVLDHLLGFFSLLAALF